MSAQVAPNQAPRRARGERGRIMILLVGLLSVVLSLVLVTAGATSLHLERKRLVGLADAAAAHAADAVDEGTYFATSGEGEGVPLTEPSVREAAEEYLRETPLSVREHLAGVRVGRPTGTTDGRTAQVTIAARLQPAILPAELWAYLEGVEVRVTSTARAQRG